MASLHRPGHWSWWTVGGVGAMGSLRGTELSGETRRGLALLGPSHPHCRAEWGGGCLKEALSVSGASGVSVRVGVLPTGKGEIPDFMATTGMCTHLPQGLLPHSEASSPALSGPESLQGPRRSEGTEASVGELAPRLPSSCLAEAQPFQFFSFIVSVPQGGGRPSERDAQTPAPTSPLMEEGEHLS